MAHTHFATGEALILGSAELMALIRAIKPKVLIPFRISHGALIKYENKALCRFIEYLSAGFTGEVPFRKSCLLYNCVIR